jgi:cobalamin biosynthesis protein CobW
VIAIVDGAALAEGRVAADLEALGRQRGADSALDHDAPIEEVFEDQIACADLVVLNKRDLLDHAAFDRALAAVCRAVPGQVKVIPVANGKVDPAALLGLGIGAEDGIANRPTRHDAAQEHDHDDFDSLVVSLPEIADPAVLARRASEAAHISGVLRIKGFAAVSGKPFRLLLQVVGPRVSHQYDRPWTAAEGRHGRLVVIGLKGFDHGAVTKALRG